MWCCYEPGHFATFSHNFHFNTTFTRKTTSHKRSGLTYKIALVLMHWDIHLYIGYQQFIFWYLMEERLGFTFISLLSFRAPHRRHMNGENCVVFGRGTAFQTEISRVPSQRGYWECWSTNSFRPHCDPGVDTASNTNGCQGCLLGDKGDCVYGWQLYNLQVPTA